MHPAIDLTALEGFEWDEENLEHIAKHDVDSSECEEVFSRTPILILEDKTHSHNEKRFQVLGWTKDGRLLFLVFTIRHDKIRVISARNQNKKERKIFEQGGDNI